MFDRHKCDNEIWSIFLRDKRLKSCIVKAKFLIREFVYTSMPSIRNHEDRNIRQVTLNRLLAQRSQRPLCSQSACRQLEVLNSYSSNQMQKLMVCTCWHVTYYSFRIFCQLSASWLEKRLHSTRTMLGSRSAWSSTVIVSTFTCLHPTAQTPVDYEVRGVPKRRVDHLRQRLVEEWHRFNHSVIQRAVRHLHVRPRAGGRS